MAIMPRNTADGHERYPRASAQIPDAADPARAQLRLYRRPVDRSEADIIGAVSLGAPSFADRSHGPSDILSRLKKSPGELDRHIPFAEVNARYPRGPRHIYAIVYVNGRPPDARVPLRLFRA